MSENNHESKLASISGLIAPEKWQQFQQWCAEKQLNPQIAIAKIIDACLQDEQLIISFLFDTNNDFILSKQIKLYLDQYLQELIQRIEKLEQQNGQSILTFSSPSSTITQENVTDSQPRENQNITYLPRNEVWRRLKETNYVKYAGYDSFLKAKGHEFTQYGIFFDSEKKRFYVIDEN